MRIAALETVPYALPFRAPYVSARGRLERRELLLVRLRADDGMEGLGEAAPMALRGGPSLEKIDRELRELAAPQLVGADVPDRPGIEGLSPQGFAAVEMALLDLAGKLAGAPAWRLLGAKGGRAISCNATLVSGVPDAVAADAERWSQRGFSTFKLKVGVPGDVGQVEAVRRTVGADARIRVDANGVWSPQQALERLGAMEPFGLELAEQPAPALEDLAVVRGQTAIPIAADESVASVDDARRAVELGACQLTTVKLAKVGGIAAARRVAAELPVYLSSALDGPLGIAAAAHLVQALPREGLAGGLAHGLATQELFAETVASVQCEVRDGMLHLPSGPGLGVELDGQALERHRH
jgi:o-succinylbenzoate synthase